MQAKPNHAQQGLNQRQCPEFLLHTSLSDATRLPGSGLPPRGCMYFRCCHWPHGSRPRRSLQMHQPVGHEMGKEAIPSFPWAYNSFPMWPEQVLFSTQTSMCWGESGPPTNPFFFQVRLIRFSGAAPPPAAILTSMTHMPAFS